MEILREQNSRAKYDDLYRAKKRELKRLQQEDIRTSRLRLDLQRRENEAKSNRSMVGAISQEDSLERLRRETEEILFSDDWKAEEAPDKQKTDYISFEQHMANESEILARAAAFTNATRRASASASS